MSEKEEEEVFSKGTKSRESTRIDSRKRKKKKQIKRWKKKGGRNEDGTTLRVNDIDFLNIFQSSNYRIY